MIDGSNTQYSFDNSQLSYQSSFVNNLGKNNDRSQFEFDLILAYKSVNMAESHLFLISAINNIHSHIDDIKSQPVPLSKSLLTKGIAERLRRIANRHYFHLTIQIGKIYIALLNKDNLPYVSIDSNSTLLIQISNDVIILLDVIKHTVFHKVLLCIIQDYLKYLLNTPNCNLSPLQRQSIDTLLTNLPSKYISDNYASFSDGLNELLIEKPTMKTFNEFTMTLGLMMSLDEQYDALKRNDCLYFITNYLKVENNNTNYNKDDSALLFSIGKMISLFVFNTKYTIKASNFNVNNDNDSNDTFANRSRNHEGHAQDDSCKTYLLLDVQRKNVSKIQSNSYINMSFSFLNNSIYEITKDQIDIMINSKSFLIYLVKLYVLKVLHSFSNKFDLLYVCFILLKRVWFTFNEVFIKDFGQELIQVIDNIQLTAKDNNQFAMEMNEVTDLLHYFSCNYPNEPIGNQIKERLSYFSNSSINDDNDNRKIKINNPQMITEDIYVKDCNILIGYPLTIAIEPGAMHTQYFEIAYSNSLIYIFFSVNSKDISFSLLKYNTNEDRNSNANANSIDDETDKGHFIKVFQLDYVKCSIIPIKLILFAQSPGVYKVVFDNSYSWITSKEVKCRIVILKPLSPILSIDTDVLSDGNDDQMGLCNKKKFNVYYNSIDYSIDIGVVEGRIKDCNQKRENGQMVIIPIIFYKNRLSLILNENTSLTYIDLNNSSMFSSSFMIESIEAFLLKNSIIGENKPISSIVLSFLSLNNHINDDNEEETEGVQKEKTNETIINKETIGNHLRPLIDKYSNKIQYHFNILSDVALIQSLYNKEKRNKEYETIVYFHIDSNIAQVSVYNDGIIYEEITGFDYEGDKSLIENAGLFIEVIQKTNESFENIKIEVSYTNVDIALINNLIINVSKATHKIINSIIVYPMNLTYLHLIIN